MSLLWVLLHCPAATAGSAPIELDISNGRTVLADYWQGELDRPPLLILHGFLQTSGFPTVSRLAESLAGDGFSVLTPSLSLGIDRRERSLACEAIHTHDMDGDVEEIRTWVEWLRAHSGQDPVLIGHSAAGVQLLALLSKYPESKIRAVVAVSLAGFGPGPVSHEKPRDAALARRAIAAGSTGLGNYALAYCRRYVTDARSFLSYYDWSRAQTLEAAAGSKPPVTIVIGSDDDRIDGEWLGMLESASVPMVAVEGANHFFDREHEFELLDAIEGILSELSD